MRGFNITTNQLTTKMSLTLEDFMRITSEKELALKKERQEERAEQERLRNEDQKTRAAENKAHLEAIEKLIETGVREEVKRVVEPLQKRNEDRFEKVEMELSELKRVLVSKEVPKSQSHGPSSFSNQQHVSTPSSEPTNSNNNLSVEVLALLEKARRTISLRPIFKKDVDLQFRTKENVTTENEAFKEAVTDYLYYELKYRLPVPNIVRVFSPANTPDYDRLYVEFETEYMAEQVASYAKYIKKNDHQVSIYVPGGFQSRFRAFNLEARLLRTAQGTKPGDVKTKVKYGRTDFCLFKKTRESRWNLVNIDCSKMPQLESSNSTSYANVSPPPGRPSDQASRKRAASSSPSNINKKSSKVANQGGNGDGNVLNDEPTETEQNDINSESNSISELPVTSSTTDGAKNPRATDFGNFVNNQVSSPKTGTVTFNFTRNMNTNRRLSLNF